MNGDLLRFVVGALRVVTTVLVSILTYFAYNIDKDHRTYDKAIEKLIADVDRNEDVNIRQTHVLDLFDDRLRHVEIDLGTARKN